jgi:8-hydroxy-5-deazaflavin:NADPH oxidoreductase
VAAREVLGFLGGTGPLGRGLALRLAVAGHPVVLGSRDAERARAAATSLRATATGAGAAAAVEAEGEENRAAAARADVLFVCVPADGLRYALEQVAPAVRDDTLVISAVNALAFDGEARAVPVEGVSSAQLCARLLPQARVTAAFHTVSAPKLEDLDAQLEGDVAVCGNADDRSRVIALADAIPRLRGVHAGSLTQAGTLEALTALIIAVNRHYKRSVGMRFTNL